MYFFVLLYVVIFEKIVYHHTQQIEKIIFQLLKSDPERRVVSMSYLSMGQKSRI